MGDVRTTRSVYNEPPSIPKHRHELLKWNGWGYKDSYFESKNDNQYLELTGNRYAVSGKKISGLVEFMKSQLGMDLKNMSKSIDLKLESIPSSNIEQSLLDLIREAGFDYSVAPEDRLFRSHGHTVHEIFALRNGMIPRVPDVIIWPRNHEETVKILDLVNCHADKVAVIPFGGGTSVSNAVECNVDEMRTIISIDISQMNRILNLDEYNMTARFECGIIGQDLDRRLAKLGYCVGHEPDSVEFSSLGGWIATRASGMKKSVYGNIEDIIVHVTMCTPTGVIHKNCQSPRVSIGPDIHQIILGSEGTLGIITEATLKINKLPECKVYDSILFPNFEKGFNFLREVSIQKIYPASIRLMDNGQFLLGQALKPDSDSIFSKFYNYLKRIYVTKIKGYNPTELCVVTLLYEGDRQHVNNQSSRLLKISSQFEGMSAGPENGKQGYLMTFAIAYLRDIGMDYCLVAESFETSVPWDRALNLCQNVKHRIQTEATKAGITTPIVNTCRITQLYDTGVCIYFYFGFNYAGIKTILSDAQQPDPVQIYTDIESAARDEILACGGSLSHHHGVGKLRRDWMSSVQTPNAIQVLNSIKQTLDPNNLFASGNLIVPAKL